MANNKETLEELKVKEKDTFVLMNMIKVKIVLSRNHSSRRNKRKPKNHNK